VNRPLAYTLGEPLDFDDFPRVCGHFVWAADRGDGEQPYRCSHPENDSRGLCFSFSCPLAWSMYPDEPEDRPYFAALGIEEGDEEEGFVVPYRLPLDLELAPDVSRREGEGGKASEDRR
jgi:hypothetical protein